MLKMRSYHIFSVSSSALAPELYFVNIFLVNKCASILIQLTLQFHILCQVSWNYIAQNSLPHMALVRVGHRRNLWEEMGWMVGEAAVAVVKHWDPGPGAAAFRTPSPGLSSGGATTVSSDFGPFIDQIPRQLYSKLCCTQQMYSAVLKGRNLSCRFSASLRAETQTWGSVCHLCIWGYFHRF